MRCSPTSRGSMPCLLQTTVSGNSRCSVASLHCVDVVAHQAARLAFATDEGDPLELDGGVFRVAFGVGKRAENGPQQVVADLLSVVHLVEVVGGILPIPIAIDRLVVFGDGHGPRHFGETRRGVGLLGVPDHAGAEDFVVRLFRAPAFAVAVPAFAEFIARFAAVVVVRAGPVSESGVKVGR